VVWNVPALLWRGLGCADIKPAVDLRGIAGQNLSLPFSGQGNGKGGLAGRRRAHNGYQREGVAACLGSFLEWIG
jgi:hypothetical protein